MFKKRDEYRAKVDELQKEVSVLTNRLEFASKLVKKPKYEFELGEKMWFIEKNKRFTWATGEYSGKIVERFYNEIEFTNQYVILCNRSAQRGAEVFTRNESEIHKRIQS